jgi:hypothetical protein
MDPVGRFGARESPKDVLL